MNYVGVVVNYCLRELWLENGLVQTVGKKGCWFIDGQILWRRTVERCDQRGY